MAIKLSIVTAFDDKGLKQAQREIAAVGKSISRSLDMAVGAAAVGAVAGLTSAVKAASNYAAEYEGVNQIFKDAAGTVQAFAKTAAQTAGMSETIALRAAKSFGGFATAAGLSGQAAAGFSTNLVQAAADLGSFFDVPVDEALAAIKSGLAGETDPLKKFNILLNDSSLRAEAMAMGLTKTTKEALTPQQKVLAANALILKGLGAAQGDFVNYQDTFGNAIKTISAEFQDMQAQIGEQLLPVLEAILPTVRELIPQIGEKLKAAVASVDWKSFFTGVVGAFSFLIEHIQQISTFIAIMWTMSKAFAAVRLAISLAEVALAIFTGTLALNPVGLAVIAVGALATAWVLAGNAAKYYNDSVDATDKGGASGSFTPKSKTGGPLTLSELNSQNKTGAKTTVKKTVDPMQALKDQLAEIAKKSANTLSDSEIKKAAAAAAKAAKAKAKAAADELKKAIEESKKLAEDARKTFNDLKSAFDDFSKSFEKTSSDFQNAFKYAKPLGAFEQQAVDSFEAIKQSAQDAFDNKLITAKSLTELTAYADKEKVLLQDIGRQRDVLAKKISIAQSISDNIMGAFNITDVQAKQVTKSFSSIIGGIAVTTTQTFDEIVAGGIADSFRKLVDKTKAFASNLIKLKALGLNGQLFKQIVDAGTETGGATAEAIIAGGADAVKELNGLFGELTAAGASIAETATPVMYDLGDQMTNSFIDGLRSQDQQLIDTANAMATLFAGQFKSALDSAILPNLNASMVAAGLGMDNTDYIRGYGRVTSSGTTPTGGAITIQVNAGVIANKQELPQIIVDALGTYTKQSGAGGLTRVLGL